MGWFAPRSPVSAEAGAWISRSMDWCLEQFGPAALSSAVLLPDASFFPGGYTGSAADVEDILVRVCARMGVARSSVVLELTPWDVGEQELLAHLPGYASESAGVAGHYLRRDDGFVVAVSESNLTDPVAVVAVIAHELGHVRLLGEGRIEPDRRDGEQLTDLVTVALGLGMFNANAAFDFKQSDRGWRAGWLGYLSEEMFGYALAYYARQRGESEPGWASALDPNPRGYLKQAARYLRTRPETPPSQ
jgi:hypothetical protein